MHLLSRHVAEAADDSTLQHGVKTLRRVDMHAEIAVRADELAVRVPNLLVAGVLAADRCVGRQLVGYQGCVAADAGADSTAQGVFRVTGHKPRITRPPRF